MSAATAVKVETEEEEFPEASLRNIIESDLKWVFVGGKGGVGKTTTSCCLAIQLAKVRQSVLIISTDPAHNLSDAFGQKFGKDPGKVDGFDNLFVMEIDPSFDWEEMNAMVAQSGSIPGAEEGGGLQSMLQDLTSSIPGIDEIISFAELMKQVEKMDYSTVVFDTAPTGHTLRLLSFPSTLEGAFGKLMALKNKFSGLMSQFGGMMGQPPGAEDALMSKLDQTRDTIEKVNRQFRDPNATTFVCVCIAEFLSIYETERLVQELAKFEIDSHNIVVNQVLFPDKDAAEMTAWHEKTKSSLPAEANEIISKFLARKKMQDKYINQVFDLYEDFHVVLMPLLDQEVRGVESLRRFSEALLTPPDEK
ncbi:anion-transporting atpase [Nannochloropsis oceanica]